MNLQLMEVLKQRLAASTTLDDLRALCREECARLGFHSFVYALRVPTQFAEARVIMLDGYPEGWVKRYFEAAHFEADPVMAHCASHIVPLRWSDLSLEPGSHAERVMHEAATFGMRDGVTMPVHSPQGELGILSFSLDSPPDEARAVLKPYAGDLVLRPVGTFVGNVNNDGPECLADAPAAPRQQSLL